MRRTVPLLIAIALVACSGPKAQPSPWQETTTTNQPTATTQPSDSTTTSSAPRIETKTVQVIVDGWSQAILGTREITFVPEEAGPSDKVILSPASGTVIDRLDPEIVKDLAGRLVDAESDRDCDEGAVCSTPAGGTVDIGALLDDPTQIPHYGDVYKAWGITDGVWVAEAEVPVSEEGFVVVSGDFKSDVMVAEGDGPLVLAAGLGIIFPLDPHWTDEAAPYRFGVTNASFEDDPEAATTDEAKLATAAVSGLAASGPDLYNAQPDLLTYMTSLPTGCGGVATCVPSTVEAAVETASVVTETVCHPERDGKLLAVTRDEIRRFTLPHPTHIMGLWNGQSRDELAGANGAGERLMGLGPLVEGEVEMRVVTSNVWTTQVLSRPTFVSQTNYVAQGGVDDLTKEMGLADLWGDFYTPCS